ncbi:hypothetical protein EDB87DRAFT_375363 [Lactarius vividus]|nr:hypothetical protein EDB87DRAFT_375363 [Lactarius vividus]
MDWIRTAPLSRLAASLDICFISHTYSLHLHLMNPSRLFHLTRLCLARALWFAICVLTVRSDRPARVAGRRVHTNRATQAETRLEVPRAVPTPLSPLHSSSPASTPLFLGSLLTRDLMVPQNQPTSKMKDAQVPPGELDPTQLRPKIRQCCSPR